MEKMKNKKLRLIVITCIILICLGIMINRIWAYFTTYAKSEGTQEINLGNTTVEIEERIEGMTKHIKVINTGEYEAYVRVKVFIGDKYKDKLSYGGSNKWQLGEEYYHYSAILQPKATTEELTVTINNVEDKEDFNIIVIAESTQVLYDATGAPYADWSAEANIGE